MILLVTIVDLYPTPACVLNSARATGWGFDRKRRIYEADLVSDRSPEI